jgi:hypothetical protein
LLEPAVVAAGEEVGGDGGGFGSRGHCRKVSKSAGGKAMGVEGDRRTDMGDQEARKGLHRGHRECRVRREGEPKTQAHTPCPGHPLSALDHGSGNAVCRRGFNRKSGAKAPHSKAEGECSIAE